MSQAAMTAANTGQKATTIGFVASIAAIKPATRLHG
jgi:hypothetical protein